jgi:putative tryptophan/tyrosine transport system substrate-binding protein
MNRRELMLLLGGSVAAPAPLRAQQKAMPVIGFLASNRMLGSGFNKGLAESGYIETRNIKIETRFALGDYDELAPMAADLLGRNVSLIAAIGPAAAQAAKRATSTVPIVFLTGDPIDEGLVASLARPGGNLTGVSLIDAELMAKRLELLAELVPQAKVFALLVNPNAPTVEAVAKRTLIAASARGLELHVLKAGTGPEIDDALADLSQLQATHFWLPTIFSSDRGVRISRQWRRNARCQ